MNDSEQKEILLFFLFLSLIAAYFVGTETYEVMDVKKNGVVAICKVVHEPNKSKILLNGEEAHWSWLYSSDYKELDEVEVLWKRNKDRNVVIPKDCSSSILWPTLVIAFIIVFLLIGIFIEKVRESVWLLLMGVIGILTLSFYVFTAFSAFDLKNTGSVATAQVVYVPGFFSKADYRVLVNGEERRILKGVLGSYDENEELEVYWKKDYDRVVPKNHVVSTVIRYGFLPMFFIVCLLIILYCAIWNKIHNRT